MATLAACGLEPVAVGSGAVVEETRSVGSFTNVEAGYGINLGVRIGPEASVTVRAQESLIPILRTDIEGETLRIRFSQEFESTVSPEVTIVTPSLQGIALNGAVEATVEGLASPAFAVILNGESRLTATGASDTVAVEANGASEAALGSLDARTIDVQLNGGSTARLSASSEVVGQVNGGAHATIGGDAEIRVSTAGGGTVSRG
jgi:UDP-3-O-[3-hydroxymyristoyl] glucosamine N-acyltransferase